MLRAWFRQLEFLWNDTSSQRVESEGESRAAKHPAKPAPEVLESPSSEPSRPLSPTLHLRRNPRARRYVLRVRPPAQIHVTIPRGGTEAFARRFIQEKADWITRQLERLATTPAISRAWGPGSVVWLRGVSEILHPAEGGCRLGAETIVLRDSALAVAPDWRPAVEAHLRRLAEIELPPLVLAQAARHQVPVRRITVRNQKSRWGSCSRRGTVSLNWRLVQTPLFVRDYIIAHELAHFRQMNHSARFWQVVEEFFPAWREAEAWLKRHGREMLR